MFLSETRTLLSKLAAFRARIDASHHCLFVSLWITTNTTVYVHSVLLYSIDPLFNPTMVFQCFMSLPHFSFNRALLTFQYQQRFLLIFFKPKELSKDATQSQMIQRECKRFDLPNNCLTNDVRHCDRLLLISLFCQSSFFLTFPPRK